MDVGALVVGVVGLVSLVTKFTDFLRLLTHISTEGSALRSQVAAWAAGIGGVFLYSASDFGNITLAEGVPALDNLDGPSKVIVGLAISSAAGVLVGFKKAVDNTDSAVVPPMGPDSGGPPG